MSSLADASSLLACYNFSMSQVIVLGATGMLGRDIVSVLQSRGHQVYPLGSRDINISSPISVHDALSIYSAADTLINCAAYTKVDQAETDRDLAMSVNGIGVGVVAGWCHSHGVQMIHFSTDYVFNGQSSIPYLETDVADPINHYGASKLRGELEFLESGVRGYLFRVQWLYGHHGSHFIKTITRLSQDRPTISIVNDQWGSPTWTIEIAMMIATILDTPPPTGIYHFASQGYTCWSAFARYFLSLLGSPCDIVDISSSQYPTPADRPHQSRMNIDKWISLALYRPLSWQESVQRFIKEEY